MTQTKQQHQEMIEAYRQTLAEIAEQMERIQHGLDLTRYTDKTWATVGSLQHTLTCLTDTADALLGEGEYES